MRGWLTGARRIYFPPHVCLKSRLLRPKWGASRLWLGRDRIFQLLEKELTFIVKDLPIKWNLMPEFFPLLGRAKVR
jgi:hypothetical protein